MLSFYYTKVKGMIYPYIIFLCQYLDTDSFPLVRPVKYYFVIINKIVEISENNLCDTGFFLYFNRQMEPGPEKTLLTAKSTAKMNDGSAS